MENNIAIFTKKTECQDCYKCVRECPVKAIKIENNHAQVIEDDCIMCGHCIDVCPVGAKKIRSDLEKVKKIIQSEHKIIASLAPSFISEFKDVKPAQLIAGLKKLGFYAVSETALGAEEVSATLSSALPHKKQEILISSACPTIVMYIKKYFPDYARFITNYYSPLMVHAKILNQAVNDEVKVVFIGPCISKKIEISQNQDLVEIGLTFQEIKQWLQEEGVQLEEISPQPEDCFFPQNSREGALYPIEGGMINTIKANCHYTEINYMTFSGINNVKRALNDINQNKIKDFLFLELLACEGGCVNGPAASERENTIQKRLDVINNSQHDLQNIPRRPQMDIVTEYRFQPIAKNEFAPEMINEKLRSMGKFSFKDELNCGGCGYDSCRDFVHALIEKKAEKSMCVSYMRKLAQKKANALIQTMPSGVVIVNEKGRIEECNKKFAELLGEDVTFLFNMKPGLEDAVLAKIFPEHHKLFKNALENDTEILSKVINDREKVLNLTIFTIESRSIVGGILQDITEPVVSKEHIIKNTQHVIKKNIQTVQKIAYLLGENAAESEVLLNSIIKAFSNEA